MKKLSIISSLFIASMILFSSTANVFAGGDELRLRAQLEGIGLDISGQADYRDKDGRNRFSVEVEGLTPGDAYDVMVAGVLVGTLSINSFGMADFNLDSNFEAGDNPSTQMPANFPAVDGGELIRIGPLSGTLQVK